VVIFTRHRGAARLPTSAKTTSWIQRRPTLRRWQAPTLSTAVTSGSSSWCRIEYSHYAQDW